METEKGKTVPLIVDSDEIFDEIKVGMKVYSEEEAYDFYNRYAMSKGFSVRKGNKRRSLGEPLRQREFLCSKAGYREYDGVGKVRKFNRLELRTGCEAKVRFTIEKGVWMVSYFNSQHNHELATSEERINLRSGRKILTGHADVLLSMVAAGVKQTNSYSFLRKEIGFDNINFTKRDCHNLLRIERDKLIDAGDAQSIINFFKRKQAEDPMFFYSVQVDQNNRLANFFWRDGRSKLDYDCFGDTLVFDTTYRTNKYNLVCAPFVGINNHWNSVLFGCAFLSDETIDSFVWLFETFLEAMGYQQPKSIFTDQDQAMMKAIEMVFPESSHRLCMWHISNNAKQHLASRFANSEFKAQFNKCFYGCETETEFESNWAAMIEKFELEDHSWLKRLYDLRAKWCPAFSMDVFSARTKSTQRSESMNSILHQIMNSSMSLIQVIQHYEEKAKEFRQEELNQDFRCRNGAPNKVNGRGILKHASTVYTFTMFKRFEEELMDSIGLNCVKGASDENISLYQLTDEGHERIYFVNFSPSNGDISCSCSMFETLGLLCRHALRVLFMHNVKEIPEPYILKRWTKRAKSMFESDLSLGSMNEEKSTRLLRLSELNHIGYKLFDKSSLTPQCTKIVKEKLMEALQLVEKEMATLKDVKEMGNSAQKAIQKDVSDGVNEDVHYSIHEKPVLDPVPIRTKGSRSCLMKSQLEKSQKKKKKESR
ncbi:hypothetical protein J5N97_001976 [Dioscorea zingiberensis]|uniref:SWIM-type domain-containing protein n=1 Tax=Dioscorea zingiberensis TaxID=325984 RepID=A0A9D5BT35_9LILI|nr:hypothetical protein J5N97_001976 [Dioscorea zingiberensis]